MSGLEREVLTHRLTTPTCILHGYPDPSWLSFLLAGVHDSRANFLRGAREQSGAGTKQGTYVRLCSKMFDDSPHHSYAVVVANSLAQLTQILGIGDAPDAAT